MLCLDSVQDTEKAADLVAQVLYHSSQKQPVTGKALAPLLPKTTKRNCWD